MEGKAETKPARPKKNRRKPIEAEPVQQSLTFIVNPAVAADPLDGLLYTQRFAADLDAHTGWYLDIYADNLTLAFKSRNGYHTGISLLGINTPQSFVCAMSALVAEARAGNIPHEVVGEACDYLLCLLGDKLLAMAERKQTLQPQTIKRVVASKVPTDYKHRIGEALDAWAVRVASRHTGGRDSRARKAC